MKDSKLIYSDRNLSKLDVCNLKFEHFFNIFFELLNNHTPMKKKHLGANQGEFMTKRLNKAIMTRSRLRNKYLEQKIADTKIAYDKQRNFCLNFLRRTKKNYFANINISSITDNKKFWKTVKPLFSDKISHKETINLLENDTTLSDDQLFADTCNNYFNNIVKVYVKPVFKKDDKSNKKNYRPISILPTLSNVYERLIYNPMYRYFNKLFSKFQCGFQCRCSSN